MGDLAEDNGDSSGHEELASLTQEAKAVAKSLSNDASAAPVTTELAFACECLNAVLFVLSARNYAVRERASLFETSVSLFEAYTSLTRDDAIQESNAPPIRSRLHEVATLIDQHPLRSILPPNFSAIPESSAINELRRANICLKTTVTQKEIDKDRIWRDVETENGKSLEQVGERVTIDEVTRLAFPQFKLEAIRLQNGRYCYVVQMDDPSLFETKRWTRRIVRSSIFGRTKQSVERSDDAGIIAPCIKLGGDEAFVPDADFDSFVALVGRYDALVASESRILCLQSACARSKQEVQSLMAKLKG